MKQERLSDRSDEVPRWEQDYRAWYLRTQPKPMLKTGQRGRTHKRKQRGTRKRKNMGLRQYFSRFTATGEW